MGEPILTAGFLVNRMPSRVLKIQTPLQKFQSIFSMSFLLNIWFCCFCHIHDHNRSKLDPWSLKNVLVGYSPTQKRVQLFDPKSKKIFVSMDVTFVEFQTFFDTIPLHGGILMKMSLLLSISLMWNLEIIYLST